MNALIPIMGNVEQTSLLNFVAGCSTSPIRNSICFIELVSDIRMSELIPMSRSRPVGILIVLILVVSESCPSQADSVLKLPRDLKQSSGPMVEQVFDSFPTL
jgi:hypothetical protein